MPGITLLGNPALTVFAMDFNVAATTMFIVDSTAAATPLLRTLALANGTPTTIAPLSGLAAADAITDLTINPTSGATFLSTSDGTNSALWSVSLTTGAATLIGSMGAGIVIDLAVNCSGAMYAHDISTDSLFSVNPATGARTLIGAHGLAANFAQGMDFDNNDGQLYAWIYTGGGTYTYGTFNLATGAITPLNTNTPPGEWEGSVQNTCAPPSANLSLTKTATAPTPVVLGSPVTFTLTVANAGPSAAAAVVVADPLPGNVAYVSNTCGATVAAGTLTWSIGALANGATQNCSITTNVSATGAISNTATVASSTTDPTPGNNVGTVSLGGVPAVARAVPTTGSMALWLLALLTLGAGLVGVARRH